MNHRTAILVLGCDGETIGMAKNCLDPYDITLQVVDTPAELVRAVVQPGPVAVLIGVGPGSNADLDVIQMVHAVAAKLPVIVVAKADSIDLERKARQASIFYYVVEPVQAEELKAVMDDVLRYASNR